MPSGRRIETRTAPSRRRRYGRPADERRERDSTRARAQRASGTPSRLHASARLRSSLEPVLTASTAPASFVLPAVAADDLGGVVDATVDAVPQWASTSARIVVLVVAAVLLRWLRAGP